MAGHEPVMVDEVLDNLHINKPLGADKARLIDATVGAGGHSLEMVRRGAEVLGIDADEKMLEKAAERLKGSDARLVRGNFREIDKIAKDEGMTEVDGILFDLGVSSIHFDEDDRGFSFKDGRMALDMRLSLNDQGVTAADLLNGLREDQLREMFGEVMERGEARSWARRVIEQRKKKKFTVTGDLLEITPKRRAEKINPATKAFLALRMAVNSELANLKEALPKALELLKVGGRMVVICFHSGEERVVKQIFKKWDQEGKIEILTKKGVGPSQAEIERNPRARSAKLWGLIKK